jgi:hypothetical protein
MLHLLFRLQNVGYNTSDLVETTANMTKHILCFQSEDEIISEVISEGLDLLETSFMLVCKY